MATKKILEQEANDILEFEYDGESYTAPPLKLWPLEVLESQEAGQNAKAVKVLVGDEQYNLFKAKPRTVTDLGDFLQALVDASGVTVGE